MCIWCKVRRIYSIPMIVFSFIYSHMVNLLLYISTGLIITSKESMPLFNYIYIYISPEWYILRNIGVHCKLIMEFIFNYICSICSISHKDTFLLNSESKIVPHPQLNVVWRLMLDGLFSWATAWSNGWVLWTLAF